MRICPICSSKNQEKIFKDVVICNNCGFAYNNNCSQNEKSQYYEEMAKKSFYLSKLPVSQLYLKQQQSTADFVKKFIRGKVLDIGCFIGQLMELLNYGDIEGIDPSKKAVNTASKKGLKVICGDIFTHKFKGKYDTIILSHVLEHIVDLRKFILIISEILNDDGIVIIEVPDASKFNLEKGESFINDQKEPLLQFSYEHVNYFTPYSLKNLFINFKIVSCEHVTTTIHAIRIVFKKKKDIVIKPSLLNHINESMKEFKRIDKILNEINEPVYIWGLGAFTMKLIEYTNITKLNIKAFIDEVYKDEIFMGIPVIKKPIEDIPIIIGTMQYRDLVKERYKSFKLIEL